VLISESSENTETPTYSPQKKEIYNSESSNYKKTVITKENYGSNWGIVRTAPKTELIYKICQTITEIQVTHDTAIVEVYKNRQRLYNTLDFTADGSVISFTDDLLQGDVILIVT
jgi:alpha-ketoglutarate-dependent taurine dioxygenase